MSKFEKTLRAEHVLINQELFQEAKPVFPRWASCIVLLNKSWLKIASFDPSIHSIVESTALLYRDVSLTKTSNHCFLGLIHFICLSWWTHLKNKFPRSTLEPPVLFPFGIATSHPRCPKTAAIGWSWNQVSYLPLGNKEENGMLEGREGETDLSVGLHWRPCSLLSCTMQLCGWQTRGTRNQRKLAKTRWVLKRILEA